MDSKLFRELLEHLPPDTGMAIVLVQHLDPTHASLLAELLARAATIPVHEARNGTRLAANCAYVIPPNTSMTVADGALALIPRPKEKRLHLPIDDFFRSLSTAKGSSAIGVILSGTASDGGVGKGTTFTLTLPRGGSN